LTTRIKFEALVMVGNLAKSFMHHY